MKAYPVLTAVSPLEDYHLMRTFGENERRVYNFKPNLSHKFYSPLTDPQLFKSVSVVDGEIEWVTGQDFCPHTLYEQSIPTGTEDDPLSDEIAAHTAAMGEYQRSETVNGADINWN